LWLRRLLLLRGVPLPMEVRFETLRRVTGFLIGLATVAAPLVFELWHDDAKLHHARCKVSRDAAEVVERLARAAHEDAALFSETCSHHRAPLRLRTSVQNRTLSVRPSSVAKPSWKRAYLIRNARGHWRSATQNSVTLLSKCELRIENLLQV
jgi:hypothetical protein